MWEQPLATQLEENRRVLEKLQGFFLSALNHPTWSDWRTHAKQCFEYKEGDQWTSTELTELDKRGQPATVNNQVKVTVDRMVGQFVKQKTRVGFRGRNAPEDEPVAAVLTDVFRYVAQNNNLEFEEREVAEDGFTGGFGCLEATVSFDDLFQPEIRLRHVDPFEMYPDPDSRRFDWNEDAAFICRAKWLSINEAVELYPARKTELIGLTSTTDEGFTSGTEDFRNRNYVDFDENGRVRRVRLVECWYKVREREDLAVVVDGETGEPYTVPLAGNKRRLQAIRAQGSLVREIDRVATKLKVGVFAAGLLLEHKDSPHGTDLYPYVPYFVHRRKNGEPYSLIWIGLPLQDAINKRESKALHLLNTNQAIFEQNAVNDKVELANEMARPDGLIEVRKIDGFQLQRNTELAQTQFALHQSAIGDFRRVTGVNPEALGERSEVRSGVGIARKQAMTDVILTPVFNEFRRFRAILARLVLALVQNYYTEPKLMLITDDLGASRAVFLGAGDIQKAKQATYDVVVEDMPDTTTLQQEQFQLLGNLLPQMLPFGPAWVSMLLKMSDLRNKEELIQQVQQMSQPPPPEPRVSVNLQWDSLTPEEKIAWSRKLGMPELAQAQAEAGEKPIGRIRQETEITREQIRAGTEANRQRGDLLRATLQAGTAAEKPAGKAA